MFKNNILLTDEFIEGYKTKDPGMSQISLFTFYRTYSRWLHDENRREYWWETVRRAVEYNCSLLPTTKKEAEELYDNIFHLRQFLSGRTFWVGGTEVSRKYPTSNFNCGFIVIDDYSAFDDLFYLLLVGTGVGFRVLKEDVSKLPKIKHKINKVTHVEYNGVPIGMREDYTSLEFQGNTAMITIGDSKEGWVESLHYIFKLLLLKRYSDIDELIINYNNIRPAGEELKTFGGKASGHTAMLKMIKSIINVIEKRGTIECDDLGYTRLRPIDCLDICNIIGANVVVGGVRRTAEIGLIDTDDGECITAKSTLYNHDEATGIWSLNDEISHRKLSNNSILYDERPTREKLHSQIETMRYSGEPGFINRESASKRRDNFEGVNPCVEILLNSKGLCNLTTINALSFVKDGVLDKSAMYNAQILSTRAGYRMTNVELEIHNWDKIQKNERLLGVSLTGWTDMIQAANISVEEEIEILTRLRSIARESADNIADSNGLPHSLLITCVKPEGTLSLVANSVSSGLHYTHDTFYIRRIRVNIMSPLIKVCEELGYPVLQDTGDESNKVIEFPCKSPSKKTKYNITAIEQLENYKKFMEYYVDHNASITVTVRDNEWDDVEEWLWNNWDSCVAISFLSLDDSYYPLLPFESCTEEEYINRFNSMKPFDPELIKKYETTQIEIDVENDPTCATGACGVR